MKYNPSTRMTEGGVEIVNDIVRRSYNQMASNFVLVGKVHGILREHEVHCPTCCFYITCNV